MQEIIAVARHTSLPQVAWLLARKHLGAVYRVASPSQIHVYMPGLQCKRLAACCQACGCKRMAACWPAC
eukprot:296301-Chlamydomonas_euryale.AAC.1